MTYEEQLQDLRWIKVSKRIKARDKNSCQLCMKGTDLQVHHKAYLPGLMAWEYDEHYLITLCDGCHNKQHGKEEVKRRESLERGNPTDAELENEFYRKRWREIGEGLRSLQGLNIQIAIKEASKEDSDKKEESNG